MANWNIICDAADEDLYWFAKGQLSGRDLADKVKFSSAAGEVRKLLRNRGTTYTRRLARKALRRRGVSI